ncbi:MAG: hypothetical protein PHE68_05460 [Candidatus Peribacteraceae bacterium]|nr:hypothetical protein [Candidatus Peribacteraceae bacterium]MDD5074483.1 hypothetical protein [Candidatus Peribacteraceae bacterium]
MSEPESTMQVPWAILALDGGVLAQNVPGTSREDAIRQALALGQISTRQRVHVVAQDDLNSAMDPRAQRARSAAGERRETLDDLVAGRSPISV